MTEINKDSSGLAAGGYDVVSYFTDGRAEPGKPDFTHRWSDAEWRFATAEHRDAFAREPEKYAPQYGGHCAFAASFGGKAPSSPKAWAIVEDKLYFSANSVVRFLWRVVPGRIEAAKQKWKD